MVRLCVITSLLCAHAFAAAAQSASPGPIVGDVEGGELRAFPLAFPDTRLAPNSQDKKADAELFARVVSADLDMSGAFQLLRKESFIDTDGLDLAEVRFDDWRNANAQGLVKSRLQVQGSDYLIDLFVYEVASGKQLLKKMLTFPASDVRAAAHAAADEVFRAFTGEPGAFRTKIAVVKKVQGEKHIFVLDVDGEGVRQLSKGGGLNLLPSWSPDGRSIAFTSYRFDNPDLFEIPSAGGEAKPVSRRPGLNTGGQYSPEGGRIAVTLSQDGNSELYLLNRAGDVLKRLTNQWGIDTSPSWAPDGNRVAFVSSRGGHPDIYMLDVESLSTKRLTFKGNYNQTPAFSPRGNLIAFTARDERNRFDIFTLNVASGEIKRVTQDQGNNEEPSFSPNGRLLVFTTTRNKSKQLVISTVDGSKQTVLPSLGEHTSPSWGPFVR